MRRGRAEMTLNPLNEAPRSIWRGGEKQAALVCASPSWWRTWRVSFSRAGDEGVALEFVTCGGTFHRECKCAR